MYNVMGERRGAGERETETEQRERGGEEGERLRGGRGEKELGGRGEG
jgi:hypothetical protein